MNFFISVLRLKVGEFTMYFNATSIVMSSHHVRSKREGNDLSRVRDSVHMDCPNLMMHWNHIP